MSSISKDAPSGDVVFKADDKPSHRLPVTDSLLSEESDCCIRPTVIGLYGIQGCGKTTLLNQLPNFLDIENYLCYDGSGMIDAVTPGGLAAFCEMDETTKAQYRSRAIERIRDRCLTSGKDGIVAGHFSLPQSNVNGDIVDVHTQSDLETYTHIFYMDMHPETVANFRRKDQSRSRSLVSVPALRQWQEYEKKELRTLCNTHGILFVVVPECWNSPRVWASLIEGSSLKAPEESDVLAVMSQLSVALASEHTQKLETVILLDADKTLAPQDATELFWTERLGKDGAHNPLKQIFGNPRWGYQHKAFVQASWLYLDIPTTIFDQTCDTVAKQVQIHPEFVDLLRKAAKQKHVRTIIITAGLADVWTRIVHNANLSHTVKVIGASFRLHGPSGPVITPRVKAAIATNLREQRGLRVYAFGDSEVDIPMLKAADRAFVVSGPLSSRSKRMDVVLDAAIRNEGLHAKQVLLPPGSPRRLAEDVLSVAEWDESFMANILMSRSAQEARHAHFTDTAAAKLLMTSMRDAKVAGPALRAVHQRVGWFLATWAISQKLGLESCPIDHVQGRKAEGHRLRGENKTTIVALMRGGEPMALGVNESFPCAVFVHSNEPEDVKIGNIVGQETVILVDSVVNTGKSIIEYIAHIRKLHKHVRIIVLAGVVQANFFNNPPRMISEDAKIHVIALRLSDNQFKGQGTTDTGNRLYNTTHLD